MALCKASSHNSVRKCSAMLHPTIFPLHKSSTVDFAGTCSSKSPHGQMYDRYHCSPRISHRPSTYICCAIPDRSPAVHRAAPLPVPSIPSSFTMPSCLYLRFTITITKPAGRLMIFPACSNPAGTGDLVSQITHPIRFSLSHAIFAESIGPSIG